MKFYHPLHSPNSPASLDAFESLSSDKYYWRINVAEHPHRGAFQGRTSFNYLRDLNRGLEAETDKKPCDMGMSGLFLGVPSTPFGVWWIVIWQALRVDKSTGLVPECSLGWI
ncbi:hypothetical protein K432DRAFT_378019 [Lepidopterella palustris CBS 459.81]|uniref:Uncharacterized protein n=1 Tax=Lepidopterella palustris CBS 459.81 TaxID=1314670 RepID=A0A8E2JJU4_9PEZI|nr:hypothetical protein K432DRAFT_378019 [Lepidopterella palustris CBS 459.81]